MSISPSRPPSPLGSARPWTCATCSAAGRPSCSRAARPVSGSSRTRRGPAASAPPTSPRRSRTISAASRPRDPVPRISIGDRAGNAIMAPAQILPRSIMANSQHTAPLTPIAARVKALEAILTEKRLVDPAALDVLIDTYETKVGPRNGARVVARAWVDPAFKARLMSNGAAAVAEFGYQGRQTEDLVVVENTPTVHNLVVCTLCSCYPWGVLGLPPVWYKSAPYRSRAVMDPRGVLREFGVELPADIGIRVWDSTAETRFLVVPQRPAGTDGWSEEKLAALVTRDSMVGTGLAKEPAEAAE